MKKFLSLMLLFIPALCFVSCSNDDEDLPNVEFDVAFDNATNVDGTLYVVQGATFQISGITVTNKDSDKAATITGARYYWDYYFIGATVQQPFAFDVQLSETTPVGRHILEIECPVYAVGKTPAFALLSFNVEVVEKAEDIPSATAPASIHQHARVTDTSK